MENEEKIIEITRNLPSTIEELVDFVIVGNEAIQSFKAKLRACDKSENAKIARDTALMDGRKVSRLVIDAEIRLGELLSNLELKRNKEGGTQSTSLHSLPIGINKDESRYAREIANNIDIANKIFEEKKNDIPTRHDILKAIKHKKREEKIQIQIEEIEKGLKNPKGLYDLIIIDPPWPYGTKYDLKGRRVASPYPEMSLDEIKNIKLPIKDNCILWFWTTHQFIWDAKKIMDDWGFEYKAILVWDKEKISIGHWLRMQCEFCLLGIKGNPLWNVTNFRDIIRESTTKHSRKPDVFYKLIEDNFIGKKLDYFGRDKRKGFDIYGAGQNSLSE